MIILSLFLVLILIAVLLLFIVQPAARRDVFLTSGQKYYAHRGLYSADQHIPENSLAAFSKAAEHGYGIELDVQLTKDGKVVVFHDDDLYRCTGKTGRAGDYNYEELLKNVRLFGTGCAIPLFTEVLELIDGRVPLIVEIKSCPEWRQLCGSVLPILRRYGGFSCVESFDPRIVGFFRTHAPEVVRGQISEQYRHIDRRYSPVLRFSLSRLLCNCVSRPDFIAYRIGERPFLARTAFKRASCRVGWTLGPSDDLPSAASEYDVLIFEHLEPNGRVSI